MRRIGGERISVRQKRRDKAEYALVSPRNINFLEITTGLQISPIYYAGINGSILITNVFAMNTRK